MGALSKSTRLERSSVLVFIVSLNSKSTLSSWLSNLPLCWRPLDLVVEVEMDLPEVATACSSILERKDSSSTVSCKFGTIEGAAIERVSAVGPSEKTCVAWGSGSWLKNAWLFVGFLKRRGLSGAAPRWGSTALGNDVFLLVSVPRPVRIFPYQAQ